jgi:hypothetical protein
LGHWHKKVIVLVDDDINIDDSISVNVGGFVLLATAKDIRIDKKVTSLQGFYLAQNQVITSDKGNDKLPLTVYGGMVGLSGFTFGREVDDFSQPSELFIYRPDLWFNSPVELWRSGQGSWQEIEP